MEFEFDPAKSIANRQKHGIDFEQAKALWLDDNRFEIFGLFEAEARHLIVGMIDAEYWTAIITFRATRIRLISVRRARDTEIACYEG